MQNTRPPVPCLRDLLRAYEKLVIMETLRRNGWSRRRAAVALKISRRRLQYRMRALQFDTSAIPLDKHGRPKKVRDQQEDDNKPGTIAR